MFVFDGILSLERLETMESGNGILTIAVALHTSCLGLAADLTDGRTRALVAAGIGLISLVIGGLALARSAQPNATNRGRTMGIVALILGLIGIVLSVIHLGTSTGGFGTGSGRAGAIVALVLGLIGVNLGGLALARARRARNNR